MHLMVWKHEGNRAVRRGKWKLVFEYPGSWRTLRDYPLQGAWELYNLDEDRTENCNLAAVNPESVAELAAAWKAWAVRAQVEDWKDIGGEKW